MTQRARRAAGLAFAWGLALTLFSAAGHATTVRQMNIVDLLAHSGTIVSGQVVKVSDGFAPNGLPYTEVTLRVLDTIRGDKGETYTFRQFGLDKPRTLPDGRVYLGGRPTGWPTWREKELALVFMYPKARTTGFQTTVGLGYGKISLGNGLALNGYDNTGLFKGVKVNRALLDANERDMFETSAGPVDAKALNKFLHRAVAGRWVESGRISNAKR